MISIEDFMEDIVGKAMRGNRISIDQLSSLSNVPKDSIEELLKGKFDEIIITSIAPHLNLDTGSLIASGKKTWRPKETQEPLEALVARITELHERLKESEVGG